MKFSARRAGAARPHQAVAENVLLADDRRVIGLETGFEAEHGERDRGFGSAMRLRPGADRAEIEQPVIGEHMAHALARAFAPQRDDDALAGALQGEHVLGHRLEDVGVGLGALGGEIAPGARADIDDVAASGTANGVSRASAGRPAARAIRFRRDRAAPAAAACRAGVTPSFSACWRAS